MAIISANRYSKLNGTFVVAANESYGVGDIGRILIENDRNDMAIFNAALKSDMYELKCRTEGTLLESELQSLSENAIQDFFKSIIEKLKKFWAKMKGVFKKAYAMVTAYVVRNGKAFVAANKKELANVPDSIQIKGKVFVPSKKGAIEKLAFDRADLEAVVYYDGLESSKDFTDAALKVIHGKDYNPDHEGGLYKWMRDEWFTEKTDATLAECGGKSALMSNLMNGTKEIKDLKKSEKDMEKAIKKSIKIVEDAARQAAKKAEKDENTDKANEWDKRASKYKNGSTGVTNAMSMTMRAMMRLVKFRLSQYRIILAKAIGKNVTVESTLLESMILEAAEDVMDDDVDVLSPEEAEVAAEILAKAAEELSAEGAEGADELTED